MHPESGQKDAGLNVALAYDGLAASYDELVQGDDWMRRKLHAHMRGVFRPGSVVLDVGCGTGIDAVALAGMGVRVMGIDASSGMIERLRIRVAATGYGDWVHAEVLRIEHLRRLQRQPGPLWSDHSRQVVGPVRRDGPQAGGAAELWTDQTGRTEPPSRAEGGARGRRRETAETAPTQSDRVWSDQSDQAGPSPPPPTSLPGLPGPPFDGMIASFASLSALAPDQLARFAEDAAGLVRPNGRLILHLLNRFSVWEFLGSLARRDWPAARRVGRLTTRPFTIFGQTIPHSLYFADEAYRRFFAVRYDLRTAYGLGCLRPPHTVRRVPPAIVGGLEWLDVQLGGLPLLRQASRFFVLDLERRPT